ncbi:hypothetical protein FIBSPDRAFT_966135 [Athelia psychrophila]|uniref:Uncharacterized protein n=1 Tax=Athelia psychrophila TaxID=1759441 RepID=A0A167X3F3_9AGAM|nr:hypothetical protein FIBSPDRAFT_966135 [Fibularhizoctonia sp. CBS 109695]
MSDNRPKPSAPIEPSKPKIIIGDDMLLSLFKRAAAVDQRKKEANNIPEHKGSEDNELDSISIIINYINGNVNICNRPNCDREIPLDEALLRKLACSLHRTSAAVSAKARRDITDKPKRTRNNTRGTNSTATIGPRDEADVPEPDSVASDDKLVSSITLPTLFLMNTLRPSRYVYH